MGLAHRIGDGTGVRALVMRTGADDGVEGRRQRAGDLVGVLVSGNPDHEDPVRRAMYGPQAGQRLSDAVGGMADIDDGERIMPDGLEPAGPARLAQAAPRGGFNPLERLAGVLALQPEQEQGDGNGGVVELKRAEQADFDLAEIMMAELVIEPLPRCRGGFVVDADLLAHEQRGDVAVAVVFDQMRPQAPAVLAIDDGAAGGAGVALVGGDQFERIAEQFDMLVIDRGHGSDARADQAHRIVASADTGLEYREIAFRFLEMQAGQREQGFEGAELFTAPRRDFGDRGFNLLTQPGQIGIADPGAIDLNPFVEAIEVRRGEQRGLQAAGAADVGAERRGGALAVRSGNDHRDALQMRAIDAEGIEQIGHARQANAVAIFRKIKHPAIPWSKKCDARSSGSGRRGRIAPAGGSTGWN